MGRSARERHFPSQTGHLEPYITLRLPQNNRRHSDDDDVFFRGDCLGPLLLIASDIHQLYLSLSVCLFGSLFGSLSLSLSPLNTDHAHPPSSLSLHTCFRLLLFLVRLYHHFCRFQSWFRRFRYISPSSHLSVQNLVILLSSPAGLRRGLGIIHLTSILSPWLHIFLVCFPDLQPEHETKQGRVCEIHKLTMRGKRTLCSAVLACFVHSLHARL